MGYWIRQSKFYLVFESRAVLPYRASAKDKSTFIEAKGAGHSQFVNPYQQSMTL